MTEQEICISYKGAKNPNEQTQILAELNDTSRNEIIRILVSNDVKLSRTTVTYLYKRLDQLNERIVRKERKCSELSGDNHYRRLTRLENEIKNDEREYRDIAKTLILYLSDNSKKGRTGRK